MVTYKDLKVLRFAFKFYLGAQCLCGVWVRVFALTARVLHDSHLLYQPYQTMDMIYHFCFVPTVKITFMCSRETLYLKVCAVQGTNGIRSSVS